MLNESTYQCSFCGKKIEKSITDPVFIIIPLAKGGRQELLAHLTCLKGVVHPSVPLDLLEPESTD
jgi:hypothetical protein